MLFYIMSYAFLRRSLLMFSFQCVPMGSIWGMRQSFTLHLSTFSIVSVFSLQAFLTHITKVYINLTSGKSKLQGSSIL